MAEENSGMDYAYGLARKRIASLEAALVPFAKEAAQWADTTSNGYRPGVTEPRQKWSHAKAEFTIGDCRRAAKLMNR